MSQINMHPNPGVFNADLQDQGNVHGTGGQPRADLPQELQNARPARRSILSRIGAFLFGVGGAAAGGTAVGLGGGALMTSTAGAVATAILGSSTLVAGIATGGAALIGGAIGLGLFAGIRALVQHFRRGPAPEPRVQNQPQNGLPNAAPAADAFNNTIGNVIEDGQGSLPASLQQAADNTVARMRDLYGEALVPQGKALHYLLNMHNGECAKEIRQLGEAVSPAEMERILEKYLRKALAKAVVEDAFKPFCGEDKRQPITLRICTAKKHPELLTNLEKAESYEQMREILAGAQDKINAMADLHRRIENLSAGEKTKAKMLSIIGQKLGLNTAAISPHIYDYLCGTKVNKLKDKIMSGKIDANDLEQKFDSLAEDLAKPYVDSFAELDAADGLSEETRRVLKMDILTTKDLPLPGLVSKGIAAGQNVDATHLKAALDTGLPKETIVASLTALGAQVNEALKAQYSHEEWIKLTNDPAQHRNLQGIAVMVALDKVPGLKEALLSRQDFNIAEENMAMRVNPHVSPLEKGGMAAATSGFLRLLQSAQYNSSYTAMQAQTQVLNVFKDSDIPQELKTRWTEKVMSGEISSPAMARALTENVPGLSAEARPLMEKFILMQSYAPDDAEASANRARAQAQEMAGWANFDTAVDLEMAPVAGMVKDDITASLTQGQEFDRGISSQLKHDANRSVFTVNGEVMSHADAEEVSHSLRRALPTENAAKLVSSITNQRSFGPLNGLGMQVNPTTGQPLPDNMLAVMTKMATRNIMAGGLLHYDLASTHQGETAYTVTVRNGRATIEISESVGLDSGLNIGAEGFAKLFGKARYTLRFECDLLGQDGQSPSIESVQLSQQLLPAE